MLIIPVISEHRGQRKDLRRSLALPLRINLGYRYDQVLVGTSTDEPVSNRT
jgi:hypothetical protein